MSGVKKLFQVSKNSPKPAYIFGNRFDVVGFIAGNADHCFGIPFIKCIQDGLRPATSWNGSDIPYSSHVVQIIDLAQKCPKCSGIAFSYLTDYFFLPMCFARSVN